MTNATLNWLQEQCSNHLLGEKWLLVRSLRDGHSWKDRIARAGTASVNLHAKTIRSIVLALVNESLVVSGRAFIGQDATQLLLSDLLVAAQEDGRLKYFQHLEQFDGLARLLARSIRDFRLAELSVDDLKDQAFESSDKAADIRFVFDSYLQALEERKLLDYAQCVQMARQELDNDGMSLPENLTVLLPAQLQVTALERFFIESLQERVALLHFPEPETHNLSTTIRGLKTSFFAGYGEINEVRGVLQRVIGEKDEAQRLDDTEILYTDENYVPLLYEFILEHATRTDDQSWNKDAPVTFSEGIATVYTRPGRAIRGWLRWIASDGLQSKLVQLVREGVLVRPETDGEHQPIGYSRLASTLRRVNIGFQQERYLPAFDSAIQQAEKLKQEFEDRRDTIDGDENGRPDLHDDESPRDYGLPALMAVREMIRPIVELAPNGDDSAKVVLKKAKRFLLKCARCENKLDRAARNQLLDEIDGRIASQEFAEESTTAVLAWLEELPLASRVLRSGPKPSCAHASPLNSGGSTGRRNVFVVGMDAGRFPKTARVDPILLDAERESLSPELETTRQITARSTKEFTESLSRIAETEAASVTFSYSTRNLIEDRDQSPSPELVDVFRVSMGSHDIQLDDFVEQVGTPVSFASRDAKQWLCESDGQLAELLTMNDHVGCQAKLEQRFKHFRDSQVAIDAQAAAEFGEHDGLVPEAGPVLSPTNPDHTDRRASASRLESFGTCPRRFFLKYGLGVYPPDEWDVDPEQWLDPITLGNLVHGLFEKFMRELTSKNLVPNRERDLDRLLEIMDSEVEAYLDDFPSPSQDALQNRRDWLCDACEIFLEKEQVYCEATGAVPWVVEAAIGIDQEPIADLDCREPIGLTLKDGRVLRLGGQIDRVDRLNSSGSQSYAIWDYKSGSDWAFSQEDPFKQGRKLQSFLYVGMLRHRLAAIGNDKDAAISFGYFFPNTKTEGRRLQWSAAELKQGDQILSSICDLIQGGVFPATTNADDCTYCDYTSVCKDADFVAAESIRKATASENRESLATWRKMREA